MPDRTCADCERPMLSQRHYRQNVPRAKAQGYVRHGGGKLCDTCYQRRRRNNETVPGVTPRHRRPALDRVPLSNAELARLRAMVGAA